MFLKYSSRDRRLWKKTHKILYSALLFEDEISFIILFLKICIRSGLALHGLLGYNIYLSVRQLLLNFNMWGWKINFFSLQILDLIYTNNDVFIRNRMKICLNNVFARGFSRCDGVWNILQRRVSSFYLNKQISADTLLHFSKF